MLAIVVAVALLPASPAAADGYDFLLDTTGLIEIYRPEGEYGSYVRGWLDNAGNFVPRVGDPKPTAGPARSLWVKAGSNREGPLAATLTRTDRAAAYEYRSGVLVKGRFDDAWKFVPDVGSTVVDFKDYLKDYREDVIPPVWNLPGKLYKKGTPAPATEPQKARMLMEEQIRKVLGPGALVGPQPPVISWPNSRPQFIDDPLPARRPAAAPAPPAPVPPGVYEFVPDTQRRVELRRRYGDKEYWYIGRLDAAGTFEFDGNYLHRTGPKPAGTPEAVLLNPEDLGPCYEYRFGRLIRGRIDDKLNFVPEVGSKVIDFKDYKYAPESRYDAPPLPIWNLPGSFQKK